MVDKPADAIKAAADRLRAQRATAAEVAQVVAAEREAQRVSGVVTPGQGETT